MSTCKTCGETEKGPEHAASMAIALLKNDESLQLTPRSRVRRVDSRTFVLTLDGSPRARWGGFREIEQDAHHVLRTGTLPPIIDHRW